MKNTFPVPALFKGLVTLYFLFIGYEIACSDYLFTDEGYMLWHARDPDLVFNYWSTQGRALAGWMEKILFSAAGTITRLKYIRLLTLTGWVGDTILLYSLLRWLQKRREIELNDWALYLTVAGTAAGLFANVYIGWAVCVEVPFAVFLSLSAGWLLYSKMRMEDGRIQIPFGWGGLSVVLGVVALFIYQTAYPFMLLPFYYLFLSRKDGRWDRKMGISLLYFLGGLLVYYLLFKYFLRMGGVEASARTQLLFNPFDRLSFFFSYPMNQAFNGNFFFDTSSLLSQAIFPILFTGWILYTFLGGVRKGRLGGIYKGKWGSIRKNFLYIMGMLAWWLLGYLPQLVSQESFGPYRSMVVLDVMVFAMAADLLLSLLKEGRNRQVLCWICLTGTLVWGDYVYYAYLSHPLRTEYAVVRRAVEARYQDHVKEVVFVLAKEDGFLPPFGVKHYKDEFGLPSTFKDWTPEPLVKQIIYENTGDRQRVDSLKFTVYTGPDKVSDALVLRGRSDILFIDAGSLF